MFCVKCGAKVAPNQSFCTKCGFPQSNEVELVNEGENLNKELIKDNEMNADIGSRKRNFIMESKVKKRQSQLGIASLVLSILTFISLFIIIVLTFVLPYESSSYAEQADIEMILGIIILFTISLDIFAIGLGISGIFQRSRSRLTAFVGTIISMATLIIMIALLV